MSPAVSGDGRGKPISYDEPWLSLVVRYGGVTKFGEEIGRSRRTVHRWATGTHEPCLQDRVRIEELARRVGVRSPFEMGRRKS